MTTSDRWQPTALSDRYTVERELGRGGMATVYLARDVRHDREVAVKVLDQSVSPAAAERFLREIRIASKLTHPHVLGVYDSGESEGLLYYVMPYVDGETLRAKLTREGALPIAEAVRLTRGLAGALAYAHAHNVMHRDLKPENVLLSGGHAVVADFGIAKALAAATQEGDASRPGLTGTGMAIGTPAYMAPEQAVGDATTNHRADLYALGVIAYEMLTGSHPFAGRTAQAITAAHLTETPTPLAERRRDVPPALADLVTRLLAKDPAARPQSADEVVRALDGVATTSIETVGRAASRRRTRAAVVAGLVVAAAVGGYAWRRTSARATPGSAAIHTLAVLPFHNTSGSPDDEYFSDGLTDELAHALSGVPGLKLAGRTSSYAFKGKALPAQEIGRALGVDALVDGTVRRAGDRLRVTAQLVSTADGKVLSDSAYERRSTDVFAVQDELTRSIVAALEPNLGPTGGAPDVSRVVDVKRGTADPEAYELYLKGHYYFLQRGTANMARAITYYRQAIARDPSFARAYGGLSMVYGVLPNYVPDPTDSLGRLAGETAAQAIKLDSTVAAAQVASGLTLEIDQLRFGEALSRYRAALRFEPADQTAHLLYADALLEVGRTDEAIAELARAKEADPLQLSSAALYSVALSHARRFAEAIAAAQHVRSLDSTFHYGFLALGMAQAFGGQPDSAILTLEHGRRFHPDDSRLAGMLLVAYAAGGRWAEADRIRQELKRPGADDFDGVQAALGDMVFGDREPLVRILTSDPGIRRYVKSGGELGCDPSLDPLWSDERFRAKMHSLGVEPCRLARPWPFARAAR